MSILIKGMEMPDSCMNCMFCGFGGAMDQLDVCQITGSFQVHVSCSKLPDCPLVEVPNSHGRLIDADALHFVKEFDEDDPLDYVRRYKIDNAPTIIPADIGKVFEKFFGKDNDKDINVPNKTNADRIRAMTDEALASFLCTISNCCVGNCLGEKHCSFDNGNGYLVWLKEEAKDVR